jgi:hypothetical protein
VDAGILITLKQLTDDQLVARVRSLVAREREATAELIAHLAELDTRDVHLRTGYGSLFVYCRDALALSESEAYNRIEVARAARRYPVILELLAAGAVNQTTIRLLAPHLTAENHVAVLESARGKRKLQVEEIVARLAPLPDVPAFVRRLPDPRVPNRPPGAASAVTCAGPAGSVVSMPTAGWIPPAGSITPAGSVPPAGPVAWSGSLPSAAPPASPGSQASPGSVSAGSFAASPPAPDVRPLASSPPAPPQPAIAPLAPSRYRLQVTIDVHVLEKLRLAKDMLRHAMPAGDDAAVLDRALTALLADLARTKFAATDAPRHSSGPAPGSRHIPAEVKRAVWLRDLGRCAFVGEQGRRCNERGFVEFHHLKPYAAGGEASIDNVALRCRRHNDYEARLFFGRRNVDGAGLVQEAADRGGAGLVQEGGSGRTAETAALANGAGTEGARASVPGRAGSDIYSASTCSRTSSQRRRAANELPRPDWTGPP